MLRADGMDQLSFDGDPGQVSLGLFLGLQSPVELMDFFGGERFELHRQAFTVSSHGAVRRTTHRASEFLAVKPPILLAEVGETTQPTAKTRCTRFVCHGFVEGKLTGM